MSYPHPPAPSASDQSATIQAALEHTLITAVAMGSQAWRDAFNRGDSAAAAAMYEDQAVMVAKPFGTYTGRQQIAAFWQDLLHQGFNEVIYQNTVMTVLDPHSVRIAAHWTMNKAHGIITNELWVLQADGRAQMREDHFEVSE